MNRTRYFNYIEERLGILGYRIVLKGKLNILDSHIHCEGFYIQLLNLIYDLNLVNANATLSQNVEAIDLIDDKKKYLCQVSATNTKQKLEGALSKEILKKYPGYTFKFISIAKECDALRKDTFNNPHGILFDPVLDIVDNKMLLNTILSQSVDNQKVIYQFIKQELGTEIDIRKLDSNLATIINVLSKENLNQISEFDINSFEIERKIEHNNLLHTKPFIEEYSSYYGRVEKKYNEFDMMGSNKSLSVLAAINRSYTHELVKNGGETSDNIFFKVVENVTNKILESANYTQIAADELELCVNILVVDAFVRCKIFKNPLNYTYAAS
jgi:hypothetical protein